MNDQYSINEFRQAAFHRSLCKHFIGKTITEELFEQITLCIWVINLPESELKIIDRHLLKTVAHVLGTTHLDMWKYEAVNNFIEEGNFDARLIDGDWKWVKINEA